MLAMADLVAFDDEPRIQDLRLGEMLELSRPRKIRELIENNLEELQRYGDAPRRGARVRGNDTEEYWLNEAQALVLCMKSEAPKAADVRQEIVNVFMAWRQGKLAPRQRGELTLHAIGNLFDQKIEPLRVEIAEVRGNVTFLAKRIDDIVPRREFTKQTWDRCVHVCHADFGGKCLVCWDTVIVDQYGNRTPEFTLDHARGRENNAQEDALPCCRKCNLALRKDAFRQKAQNNFGVFQQRMKARYAGHPSKTKKPDAEQPDFFR